MQGLFGVENGEPAPAVVQVPCSPSENSSTSDNDDDKKRKGTALSRERITMQQKLKAIQHFEKNRMTQKELDDWMYKTFMLKKKLSKSAVANMFRPKDLARIKSFEQQPIHIVAAKKCNATAISRA